VASIHPAQPFRFRQIRDAARTLRPDDAVRAAAIDEARLASEVVQSTSPESVNGVERIMECAAHRPWRWSVGERQTWDERRAERMAETLAPGEIAHAGYLTPSGCHLRRFAAAAAKKVGRHV
jgi:hypothetical protein